LAQVRIVIPFISGESAFTVWQRRRRRRTPNCREPAGAPGTRAAFGGPDRFSDNLLLNVCKNNAMKNNSRRMQLDVALHTLRQCLEIGRGINSRN